MKFFTSLVLLLLSFPVPAQDFSYLQDIRLKKPNDFIENRENFAKSLDYVLSSPIDQKDVNRGSCASFIKRYAENIPEITIPADTYLAQVIESNSELLLLYEGLWVRSALMKSDGTMEDHELFVFTELSKYCRKGNNVVKTSTVNSLIKAGEENTIPDWLKKIKGED
jgi:hypothetical protein